MAAEGLLERYDQRGFSIRSVSAKELEELTRTRCWLEERALSESITNRTTAWEERLVLALHKLSRASRHVQEKPSSRDPEWEKVHLDFHQALISACRSNFLITFCNQIADQMHRYRVLTISEDAQRDCMEEHRLIAEAALDGDIGKAVAALIAHYNKSAELCQAKLG
ncbi:GntR family transcriptional regulator [Mesorhizobium sp. INR15]|uniref:GntR family transcriptional regulator n=1 Tax=Mesorhizobium sp. INR15 TaxID=2654248 RepID=UPI0027E3B5E8|nr:GntR family transcriptional regulator [Mesorhizobium sp. INR15]